MDSSELVKNSKRRTIMINNTSWSLKSKFPNNQIKTTKYNILTFIPICFFRQFLNIGNIFFLACAIVITIPAISPFVNYMAPATIAFIITLSMMREGIEEYRKSKNDFKINSRKTKVLMDGSFKDICWKDLLVGQIIKIYDGEIIPADLILIDCLNDDGECFIQTDSLDGETAPKLRTKCDYNRNNLQTIYDPNSLKGTICCDPPDKSINTFNAKIRLANQSEKTIGINQLLFRESKLLCNGWIIGVVTFTGKETRAMISHETKVYKTPFLSYYLNVIMIGHLIILFGCALSVILVAYKFNDKFLSSNNQINYTYISQLYEAKSPIIFYVQTLIAYVTLLSNIIPISLYVSIEFVKFFQSKWIEADTLMYSIYSNQYTKCLSMTLHEDMSRVNMAFCDKTGTLTCNLLKFKYASIGGQLYNSEGVCEESEIETNENYIRDFRRTSLSPGSVFHKNITISLFMECSLLCNNIYINSEDTRVIGATPDEEAIISCLPNFKYNIIEKKFSTAKLNCKGIIQNYIILDKIDFTSARRCMSIIIKNEACEIILFIKGADEVIFGMLEESSNQDVIFKTRSHISKLSKTGMRILCFGYRKLNEDFYNDWKARYDIVHALKQFKERNEQLQKLYEEIENHVTFLGATAISDSLQDSVPEVINDLRKAKIKVWMLTGDKKETAENIGKSTKLLDEDTIVLNLDTFEINLIKERLNEITANIDNIYSGKKEIKNKRENAASEERFHSSLLDDEIDMRRHEKRALSVSGLVNSYIISKSELHDQYLKILKCCETVIIYRANPGEKSSIIKFIKEKTNCTTIAIGDGGNDVPMIKEADIGVGIYGKEGKQAAFNADYAIGEFKMLWRLLFVHGQLSESRIKFFICFFFYKNIILLFQEFIFVFYNGYGGQPYFDNNDNLLYSSVFTSFPICVAAILDQEFNLNSLKDNFSYLPLTHLHRRKYFLLNFKTYLYWLILASFHSICFYFLFNRYFEGTSYDSNGKIFNLDYRGFATFSSSLFSQVMILSLLIQNWTPFNFIMVLVLGLLDYFPLWRFIYASKIGDMSILDYFNNPSLYLSYMILLGFAFLTFYIGESFKIFLTQSSKSIANYHKMISNNITHSKIAPDIAVIKE